MRVLALTSLRITRAQNSNEKKLQQHTVTITESFDKTHKKHAQHTGVYLGASPNEKWSSK